MAVTKTHPIKSTLKAAIDYILNPEKTDGKLLASSFGCGLETADIEFAWTREAAGDRGTHLGRHLIQSFAVGETTPEEAHKIGMELAGAVLGGKYEFVLTTHVDKDHLHNHLIFNAVSFVDYKKYHSNKQSYCPAACSCGGQYAPVYRQIPVPGWCRLPTLPAKSPHFLYRSSRSYPPDDFSSRLSHPGYAVHSRPDRMPCGTLRPTVHFLSTAGASA